MSAMAPVMTVPIPVTPVDPALMTAEQFAAKYERRMVELVKGRIKELPMPTMPHGKVCNWAAFFLTQYVLARDLGHVATNDTWVLVKRNPDTVRGADVSFYSYDRVPKGQVQEGLTEAVPELVVEVRSPSDLWTDMIVKMLEYLAAGVLVVVILDPKTESASVFRADDRQDIFEADDTLRVPDVLPDFAVPVRSLFE